MIKFIILVILSAKCASGPESCESGDQPVCNGDTVSYCIDGERQNMLDCGSFSPAAFDMQYSCVDSYNGASCEPESTPDEFFETVESTRRLTTDDSNFVIDRIEKIYNASVSLTTDGNSEAGMRWISITGEKPGKIIRQLGHEVEHRRQIQETGSHWIEYNTDQQYRFWSEIQANISEMAVWYAYTGDLSQWKIDEQVGNMSYDDYGFSKDQIEVSSVIYQDAAVAIMSGGPGSSFSTVCDDIVDSLLITGALK